MIMVNGQVIEYDFNIISLALKEINGSDASVDEYHNLRTELDYDTIVNKCEEISKRVKKDKYNKELKDICSNLTINSKNYISGIFVDQEQLNRYFDKRDMAQAYLDNGEYEELLLPEAKDNNLTIEEFAKLIIKLNKEYVEKQREYTSYIELFRTRVKRLINDELYTVVDNILNRCKNIKMFKTIDDVNSVIN